MERRSFLKMLLSAVTGTALARPIERCIPEEENQETKSLIDPISFCFWKDFDLNEEGRQMIIAPNPKAIFTQTAICFDPKTRMKDLMPVFEETVVEFRTAANLIARVSPSWIGSSGFPIIPNLIASEGLSINIEGIRKHPVKGRIYVSGLVRR